MLDTTLDMKIEAASLAEENRAIRREERKVLKKARRMRSKQLPSNMAYMQFNNLYLERMRTRREARYLHLARMFLKGRNYRQVEQTTHHAVDVEELYDTIWEWAPFVTPEYIVDWIEETFE